MLDKLWARRVGSRLPFTKTWGLFVFGLEMEQISNRKIKNSGFIELPHHAPISKDLHITQYTYQLKSYESITTDLTSSTYRNVSGCCVARSRPNARPFPFPFNPKASGFPPLTITDIPSWNCQQLHIILTSNQETFLSFITGKEMMPAGLYGGAT